MPYVLGVMIMLTLTFTIINRTSKQDCFWKDVIEKSFISHRKISFPILSIEYQTCHNFSQVAHLSAILSCNEALIMQLCIVFFLITVEARL